MCYLSRQTRTAMLDAINQEYIKTARAKAPEKRQDHLQACPAQSAHDPRAHLPGAQIAFTLCGGFVVETVFSIPGLGRYFIQSIINPPRLPLIMGTTIFLAAFIV